MPIRVFLAEDQAMVRGALAALLKLESDMEVLGTAGDGEEAWQLVRRLRPDLLLTDIEMPKLTGLELAAKVRDTGMPTKVVILTTFARPGYLRRALEAGASGYLLKDSPAEKLADAIRKVHRGGRAVAGRPRRLLPRRPGTSLPVHHEGGPVMIRFPDHHGVTRR